MNRRLRSESHNLVLARAAAVRRATRERSSRDRERGSVTWPARALLLVLALVSVGLVLLLLIPYLHAIVLAVLLVSLYRPVHRRLCERTGTRRNLAAFLAVFIVFASILVPSGVFLSALVRQGFTTFDAANRWVSGGELERTFGNIDIYALSHSPRLAPARRVLERWVDVDQGLATWFEAEDLKSVDLANSRVMQMMFNLGKVLVTWGADHIKPLLAMGGRVLVGFGIMLFVMFFAFRDGGAALVTLQRLSPLTRTQEEALLARVQDVSRAVVFGTGVTAATQGVAAMIAFWLVGVPALFWGTVLAAASIVPVVGTALVWVPAVGYLVLCGRLGAAAFLAIWCMLVVGSIDNFLRPLLMGGRTGMSSVAVFFSILGGLQFFGPVGIVYGPLIFGLCAVCLYIYEIDYASFLDHQDRL